MKLHSYLWEEANRVKVGVAVCVQSVVSLCDRHQALQHVSIVLHLNFFRSNWSLFAQVAPCMSAYGINTP